MLPFFQLLLPMLFSVDFIMAPSSFGYTANTCCFFWPLHNPVSNSYYEEAPPSSLVPPLFSPFSLVRSATPPRSLHGIFSCLPKIFEPKLSTPLSPRLARQSDIKVEPICEFSNDWPEWLCLSSLNPPKSIKLSMPMDFQLPFLSPPPLAVSLDLFSPSPSPGWSGIYKEFSVPEALGCFQRTRVAQCGMVQFKPSQTFLPYTLLHCFTISKLPFYPPFP